jgi:hypothetical protein
MKTVRVTMSDEAFAQLSAEARKKKLPGIASLLLSKSDVLSDEAAGADIAKKAARNASKLADGERFKLRQLFEPDDWEGFTKGSRVYAGRIFFEEVTNGKVANVADDGKSSSNHQFYVKK